MMLVDMLTWTFRVAFIVGGPLAVFGAVTYHRRTRGAWSLRPAGVMIFTLMLAFGVALSATALRILTNLPVVKAVLPGIDLAMLGVAGVALWTVVLALARCVWLILTEQPDLSNTPTNGSQDEDLR